MLAISTVVSDSCRQAQEQLFIRVGFFGRASADVESASKVAGEGCYHVTLACADDAGLEAFTQGLLHHGRYKVATELRRVKG